VKRRRDGPHRVSKLLERNGRRVDAIDEDLSSDEMAIDGSEECEKGSRLSGSSPVNQKREKGVRTRRRSEEREKRMGRTCRTFRSSILQEARKRLC